jgi:hypothetical protein
VIRARPEVALRADADMRLRAYLNDFGLMPAVRSKVQARGTAGSGPLDRYFG